MPRRKIKFEKGRHYHITNRGLAKKNIFLEDDDYKWFLDKMFHFRRKYDIEIIGYCLMPNHFHLVIRPNKNAGGIKFMKALQASHSVRFNSKWNRKGQLFEGRYHLEPIKDQRHLINTIKYIINNPVKAGLVKKPEDWPYLSFNLPEEFPRKYRPTCNS